MESCEIFSGCDDTEISFIVKNLTTLLFLPGEAIIRSGEESFGMYFLSKGIVDVEVIKYKLDLEYLTQNTIRSKQQIIKNKKAAKEGLSDLALDKEKSSSNLDLS